jgi:hypothetical protein
MATKRWGCVWFALLFMLVGSAAWGASISGTVTNTTGTDGRIYLRLTNQPEGFSTQLGTSISGAGAFTINGVEAGNRYRVEAYLDTQDTGVQHANDPVGASVTVDATSGNVSVGSFALHPQPVVPPEIGAVIVYQGNGGNIVLWDAPRGVNSLPIAEKYTVYWSSSPTGPAIEANSREVWSGDKDFFVHSGGSASLYYSVTARVGDISVSSAWTPVSRSSGTGSVNGKIYFPGVTPTGPLMVALAEESQMPPRFQVVVIPNPTSGATFTASNVAPGTYTVYPLLDLNNSGTFDYGDIGPADSNDSSATVTVESSPVSAPDITLANQNAFTILTTSHGKNGEYDWYHLQLSVQSMKKQVVRAQVLPGPQIASAIDLARHENQFEVWKNVSRPSVDDAYPVVLTYFDGSTETVNCTVTGVLDAFATPVSPVGYLAYEPNPTLRWSAPSVAPADFRYSLWVNPVSAPDQGWDVWGIPKTQSSWVYGMQGDVVEQTLDREASYDWAITVTDRYGNQAQNQASFIATDAPALNGFSPRGGVAKTTVTITGVNFLSNSYRNVYFNGVEGRVTGVTESSLTAEVPAGASTGYISVQIGGYRLESDRVFTVATPIVMTGVIRNSAETPIAGATVEVEGEPTLTVHTGADGTFTLQPLFTGDNLRLKITKSGFVATYTGYVPPTVTLTRHLYTAAELTAYGATAGKGLLIGKVVNTAVTPPLPVSGVAVTARGGGGGSYPVVYYSGSVFGGSATGANGIFVVRNVSDFDWVSLGLSKSGWAFSDHGYEVRADSVTEGVVFGHEDLYTLSVTVLGSGAAKGTVTSIPAGIACRGTGTDCTELFQQNDTVQLVATADAGSRFSGWGGACSGTGACTVAMTSSLDVSASFAENLYIRKGSSYYSSLQPAFDAAQDGETIQLQGVMLSGNVWYFSRPLVQLKLVGGYDSSFFNNPGVTTLNGRVNLQGGTLRVEKVRIR